MAVEVYRLELTTVVADRATEALESIERLATRVENRRPTVHVRANTGHAVDGISAVMRQANRLAQAPVTLTLRVADQATGAIGGLMRTLTSPLGLLGAGAGIGALTAWPLTLAGNLEQTQLAYRTFLGSQERAIGFQQRLNELADVSPFETADLERQAVGLLQLTKNSDATIRTMTNMGNAAALTGAGMEGMGRATVGLQQMFAQGRVEMGEMSQVAEGLRIPMADIRRELGLMAGQDAAAAGIKPLQFLNAMNKVLERPVSRGGFLGGMAEQSKTLLGMVSTIGDVVRRNLILPWGEGFKDEVEPRMASLVSFFKDNTDLTTRWGDELRGVARALSGGAFAAADSIATRVRSLLSSAEWGQADTQGRAGLIWQRLLIDPLNSWWRREGRGQIEGVSGQIGLALGSGLSGVIVGALGGDTREGDNSIQQAGIAAGRKFVEGFATSFNWRSIWDALVQDITNSKNPMPSIFAPGSGFTMDDVVGAVAGVPRPLSRQAAQDAMRRPSQADVEANERPASGGGGVGRNWGGGEPLTRDQYNDRTIRAQFRAAGLDEATVESACGPIMAAGMARALGRAADPAELARWGASDIGGHVFQPGPGADPNSGMRGGADSILQMLQHAGVDAAYTTIQDAQQRAQRGEAVGLNAPRHYMLATGYDPATDTWDLGSTGTSIKGGKARMTTAEIAAAVGAPRFIRGAPAGGVAAASRLSPDVTARAARGEPHRAAIQAAFGDLGPDVVDNMTRIVGLEGGSASARKNDEIEDSVGIGQVNQRVHPQLAEKYDLYDPVQNARAMREVYDQQGYGAWYNASTQLGLLGGGKRSHQLGGVIAEPVVGVGLTTGAGYSFAEQRPERVVDTAGATGGHRFDFSGMSFNINGADLGSGEGRRAAARALVDDVLREMHARLAPAAAHADFSAAGR